MTENREQRTNEENTQKIQEFDYLGDLVQRYTPRTVNDLINKKR